MEITNQNLEEMLAMVICVVIPVVVRIPLLASLGRFSHLGTIYLHKIKKPLLFTLSLLAMICQISSSPPLLTI
jgi:ABC-type molybdate transport system permease subunit